MTAVRIVLTTRPGVEALRLLDEAAILARDLRAELAALFVEDADLLGLAALPFTREVGMASGAVRTTDLEATTRLLARQAEEVRTLVARTASALDLHWSFAVTRGHVLRVAVAAVAEPDLVLLAPRPAPVERTAGAESTRAQGDIAVLFDGSPAGARALGAAIRLAGGHSERVSLVVPSGADREALRRAAARLLGRPTLPDTATPDQLRRRPRRRALVVSLEEVADDDSGLQQLLANAGCPLLLVP